MASTVEILAELGSFVRAVSPEAPRVDVTLPALRRLLDESGVAYRIVGGVAVVHHGYLRATKDVDVLVDAAAFAALDDVRLRAAGFVRERADRLLHASTGVRVDVLRSGTRMARPGAPCFPDPTARAGSLSDPGFIDLAGLVELKLHAQRRQDEADVVALLKPLDEGRYTELESSIAPALRPLLTDLRRDALEELSWGEG